MLDNRVLKNVRLKAEFFFKNPFFFTFFLQSMENYLPGSRWHPFLEFFHTLRKLGLIRHLPPSFWRKRVQKFLQKNRYRTILPTNCRKIPDNSQVKFTVLLLPNASSKTIYLCYKRQNGWAGQKRINLFAFLTDANSIWHLYQ